MASASARVVAPTVAGLLAGFDAVLPRGGVLRSLLRPSRVAAPQASLPKVTPAPVAPAPAAVAAAQEGLSQRQRMLAGLNYYPANDAELQEARAKAQSLAFSFNHSTEAQGSQRPKLLSELLGSLGEGSSVEAPFQCDYGCNTYAGKNVSISFDVIILDCGRVDIGENVVIGPGVHIYTATHSLDPVLRASGECAAKPVRIGKDAWIGGGSKIYPGVSIGEGSVIGAGSVVARDVPAGWIYAGNPAKPIRRVGAPRSAKGQSPAPQTA